MKRVSLIGLCLIFLVGCASTLTISKDGAIVAKDYTLKIDKDGNKTYVPNRWFTTGIFSSLFKTIESLAPVAAPIVEKVITK